MAPYFARAPVPHNSETYDPLYTIKITDFLGFNSRVLPLDSLPSFSPSSFFSKGGGYFGGGDDSLEEREPETEEETEETKEKTYLFVEGDAEEGLGDGFCESIELEEYRSRPSFLNNEFVFGCAVLAGMYFYVFLFLVMVFFCYFLFLGLVFKSNCCRYRARPLFLRMRICFLSPPSIFLFGPEIDHQPSILYSLVWEKKNKTKKPERLCKFLKKNPKKKWG